MATQSSQPQRSNTNQEESIWSKVKEHVTIKNVIQISSVIKKAFSINDACKTFADYDALYDAIAQSWEPLYGLFNFSTACSITDIQEIRRKTEHSVCLTRADKNRLLNEITNAKQEILGEFLKQELLTFLTVTLAQVQTLSVVWKEVSNSGKAENIIIESNDLRKNIEVDLVNIKTKTDKLAEEMKQFAEGNAIKIRNWTEVVEGFTPEVSEASLELFNKNRQIQEIKIRNFHSKLTELDGLYKEIRNKMESNIKIKINEKITRLKYDKVNCYKDGIIDGIYLANGLYELLQVWSSPMNMVKNIKMFTTLMWGGLLATNVKAIIITEERLKLLQEEWIKVEQLDAVLGDIQRNIKLMEGWRKQMDEHALTCLEMI